MRKLLHLLPWLFYLSSNNVFLANESQPKPKTSILKQVDQVLTALPDKEADINRKITSKVLAYITPWNGFGYDQAKKYHQKLDMISPTWLQINNQYRSFFEFFVNE